MSLFSTLLRLYPRTWRARYEDEFSALLEQNSLALIDLMDIALGALDAHLRPQVTAAQVENERSYLVNRASFTKWSGMAGMAGSVLVLLGLVGTSVFTDSEYPYTYDGLDIGAGLLFLVGVALTIVFAVGFFLKYARKIGGLGQAGLLLALAALASMGLGGIGHLSDAIRGYEVGWWWEFYILGLMGTMAGGAMFSLAGILRKAIPTVGSRLAAIGGFGGVAILLSSMGLVYDAGPEAVQVVVWIALTISLMIFKVGLFLLGYALWSEREAAVRPVEPAAIA